GRAGRDGDPAHARLVYRQADLATARHLAARGVSHAIVATLATRLADTAEDAGIDELADAAGPRARSVTLALARLVDVGAAGWGEGTIRSYHQDQVTVLFDDHGYRDLLVSIVVEKDLLRAL